MTIVSCKKKDNKLKTSQAETFTTTTIDASKTDASGQVKTAPQ
ncbi:hypothetical protein ACFX5D_07495 [Flavobacterium sp. LB3P45]|uniref:Uncharacterized protein n=1 Tax=Flavobacterium fructosi TaxID=3230416 RepID=A0ABW6HMR5_9FLAO